MLSVIIFTQIGAPPFNAIPVKRFLLTTFGEDRGCVKDRITVLVASDNVLEPLPHDLMTGIEFLRFLRSRPWVSISAKPVLLNEKNLPAKFQVLWVQDGHAEPRARSQQPTVSNSRGDGHATGIALMDNIVTFRAMNQEMIMFAKDQVFTQTVRGRLQEYELPAC
ncbi:hypothetical protein TNCV_2378231 [Trichonephila clavipes]|nr:hypothetical protein TNCV_2378231 [Trichonephila clavipes]